MMITTTMLSPEVLVVFIKACVADASGETGIRCTDLYWEQENLKSVFD